MSFFKGLSAPLGYIPSPLSPRRPAQTRAWTLNSLLAAIEFNPDPIQRDLLSTPARRVILNCTRQWGKSSVASIKAILTALTTPQATIIAMSPSARQSGEFLNKAKHYLRAAGFAKLPTDGVNKMSVLLPNRSRIIALPGVEATVRGFSAVDLLIIDEAAQVHDNHYHAAGPMLAVKNGALWLLSTPFGARGFFWKEWQLGGDSWRRVEIKATACPRISKEFLDSERRRLNGDWFRQEYLCEFVGFENSPFSPELLQRALVPHVEPLF
jgi:hypothetical protein